MKSEDQKPNTIDLKKAEAWTKKWRGVEGSYNKHHECHGFLIPADDLRGLLAEEDGQKGVQYVRAYLAVDENNDEKLVIVGTESEDGGTTYKDLITGYNGTGDIYDFVRPCPPKCDINSPLNK
tara:strand:- start:91 stop:459 length:369 start_codon:yes stop_codon:yes gene_type:complete